MKKFWFLVLALVFLVPLGCEQEKPSSSMAREEPIEGYKIEDNKITLFWGQKPTGGFSINIENMTVENETLKVNYSLHSPGGDEMVTQAITHPQDSARLPDEDFSNIRLNLTGHRKGSQ